MAHREGPRADGPIGRAHREGRRVLKIRGNMRKYAENAREHAEIRGNMRKYAGNAERLDR